MASDTKILQLILDGQVSIKKEMKKGFTEVGGHIDETNKRLDKLGLQFANLEDDIPTIEEFEDLEKKVVKIQKHLACADS